MLIEKIGDAAMLEQTAEECAELAKACLKYARFIRNENPTFKNDKELWQNLQEEVAEVEICIRELNKGHIISKDVVSGWKGEKIARMIKRLGSIKNELNRG